jgi:hypothetical protein
MKHDMAQVERDLEEFSHDIERMLGEEELLLLMVKRSPKEAIRCRNLDSGALSLGPAKTADAIDTSSKNGHPRPVQAASPRLRHARPRKSTCCTLRSVDAAPLLRARYGDIASLDPASKRRIARSSPRPNQGPQKEQHPREESSLDLVLRIRLEPCLASDSSTRGEGKDGGQRQSIPSSERSI